MNLLDESLLRRAIAVAAEARRDGNAPFGSLLADANGAVLREECNTVLTDGDISAHPELKLAVWAARELEPAAAAAATLYTSCEPCPMCAAALQTSGVGKVVFALSGEQLAVLKGTQPPRRPFTRQGPGLLSEVTAVFDGYYR